ncbi:GNAT family N-acetyltransferase [Vibrio natriegens]|uniref:GCN5 family acetyltransferase n=1 Tax=Vibrio natriegens NBRC 15636 = ATCC 14048 = DSM 759 TaxID=1219067 RepID=A0AAN1CYG6_VIBNA|nr:GNAT family N-acetyltransferase [Vibrio natriegens]ALR17365.1 GCN5 family acetyltransferase [Vibrio natriegens NBRC 15636 = ATCC 14048 = DSM 759]ANQ14855.1 GCN5 family acetyltransferase [Vibrio natriegens NBRC 15636 = ATCC 14048 = DSM 759]EPM41947.1 acetyltransferase GCN5 [Vibrio natriegens NBRC 15636 = ATCC 14048 = DSM 759]MDX6029824.1 GNAT family N-acetyltransferase [Vibrio natriegens NBRC 15636 = ATCC 14048 = DSM 759]UUI13493.1 GNAT family N-acetyltransferase [Vibrio natriegens]
MEIIVRPTMVEDAAALVEIYSQPKAQRETLQLPNPSVAMWVERLSNMPAGVYSYVAEVDGKVVGNIGFHHSQRPRTSHTASFGIGVHDRFHGLGVGSKLIETVTELADNWLNVRRIQIEVNADNDAAIGLYKEHGFEIEGEAIDGSFRDGEFINTYYMARIRPSKN